jgi:hypothetical protein
VRTHSKKTDPIVSSAPMDAVCRAAGVQLRAHQSRLDPSARNHNLAAGVPVSSNYLVGQPSSSYSLRPSKRESNENGRS